MQKLTGEQYLAAALHHERHATRSRALELEPGCRKLTTDADEAAELYGARSLEGG